MKTVNTHKVSAKVWRKWSEQARSVFNGVYEDISQIGQPLFLHPKTVARKLSTDEFKTIAHNAAWTAADQVDEPGSKSEVHEIAA